MHDKTLMFFLNKALAKAANTEITSKLIDTRYNGDDIDGRLFIKAQLGASASDGYVRFKLRTSANGSDWIDVITATNVGAKLYAGRLPLGLKRYLKAEVKVLTAIDAATTVFAEITDALEHDLDTARVQGTEDVAKQGDAVRAVVEA
jgi:hypothetical protein